MRAMLAAVLLLAGCQSAPADAPVAAAAALPQTVSAPLSADAEAAAARECGSAVRPETVHHESNVVTFRCLREER